MSGVGRCTKFTLKYCYKTINFNHNSISIHKFASEFTQHQSSYYRKWIFTKGLVYKIKIRHYDLLSVLLFTGMSEKYLDLEQKLERERIEKHSLQEQIQDYKRIIGTSATILWLIYFDFKTIAFSTKIRM